MSVFIDDFEIDVAVSEEHVFEAELTPYPVEVGADIVDHVQILPIRVVLEGLVSDTPIGPVALSREIGSVPSLDAYLRLVAIRDAGRPVTIVTSIREYGNMVLTSLQIPRDSETGDALRFRANFSEVILVVTERTTVIVILPRAKKKVNRGNKASKSSPDLAPTPSATTKRSSSLLHDLFN